MKELFIAFLLMTGLMSCSRHTELICLDVKTGTFQIFDATTKPITEGSYLTAILTDGSTFMTNLPCQVVVR